jgi:hypothetical protein
VNWQGEIQHRFGSVVWFDTIRPLLQTMGAFRIADATGFRLLLALLAFILLARLVESIERLWLGWKHRVEREDALTVDAARVDGLPWGDLGALAVYLGALMILLGAAITSSWGWRSGPFPLPPGENVPLAHGTDLTLRLVSLNPDGQRGFGELWREEDTLVSAGELAVGQYLEGDGVGVYLVGSGDAVQVQATDSDGQPLELITGPGTVAKKIPIVRFTSDEPRQLVGVLDADLVLLLTNPGTEQAQMRPQVQVYESGSGEFILERNGLDNTELVVGDVSISLTPIAYAKVRAVHDPGGFWIQLGAITLVAGFGALGWRLRQKQKSHESEGSGETVEARVDRQSSTPAGIPASETQKADVDGA